MSPGTYCESYEIIPSGPKRLLKTKFSKKKATSPVKKTLWPLFPASSSVTKLSGPFKKLHEVL